ncbi:glutathione S-transferase family protein [Paraburkholderia caffeinilytica]|uniref:glutathione S-transferase family protein n=1 Tax=Paraburkholderia caffeinilytica TaxID=1761016 RepID=UPI003DA10DB7
MSMELYGRRSSINVQKVLWCLAELGLIEGHDFQRIDAGLQFGVVNTPEFLALNPNGLVPTLVDGDVVLWESNTIVRYLASLRGEGALLPVNPAARAEVERWMDWQLGTLWATLRVAFLGLTRVPEAERNYDAIRISHRETARLLRIADDALCNRQFLAQRRFTVADIGVALAAVRWFDLAEQFADVFEVYAELPFLKDWLGRVTDRPAYRTAMGR